MNKKDIENLVGESMEDMGIDYDEWAETCDGCGTTSDENEICPLCCGLEFVPGSEPCIMCKCEDECAGG